MDHLEGGVSDAEVDPLPKGGGDVPVPRFKCVLQAINLSVSFTLTRYNLATAVWRTRYIPGTMSDSIKNVAIFGATGMTGQATLAQAVAAGEEIKPHTSIDVPYRRQFKYQGDIMEPNVIASERLL